MADTEIQQHIEQALVPLSRKLDAVAQELDQLNRQGKLPAPSRDIVELLRLCEQWQTTLHNNFSCRTGALQRDWENAATKSELPDRGLLRQKARRHLQLQWQIDNTGIRFAGQSIDEGLQLNLHGLWQGWVLERVAGEIEKIAVQQQLSLGNFSVVFGNLTLAVNKSSTFEIPVALDGVAQFQVPLKNQTLAVLDRKKNVHKVAHYPMSKLLVPKEGWPIEFVPSLLVRAATAIEAGVMAQSLISMSVYDALEQVNKTTGVTALAITETGMFFASKEWWYSEARAVNAAWSKQKTFWIDYEIPALDVAEYRRPYVAIWITDDQGNSVRQLQILGGNRWLRDLRLWWRKVGRSDESLVDALAGATRKPGRYRVDWDGRDSRGNTVPQGAYQLQLEVVREHGEHELLSLPFNLNGQSVSASANGIHEIGRVTIGLN